MSNSSAISSTPEPVPTGLVSIATRVPREVVGSCSCCDIDNIDCWLLYAYDGQIWCDECLHQEVEDREKGERPACPEKRADKIIPTGWWEPCPYCDKNDVFIPSDHDLVMNHCDACQAVIEAEEAEEEEE
jgi:hypothetical protein